MEQSAFSHQVRKSILFHSTMSILIIGLTVALVSVAFLYFKIKSELTNNLLHALHIRSMAVQEFTNRASDIALQITSRTKLRQKLEEYNQGTITLEQLVVFSAPLLNDAMRQSREVAGISRLDAANRLVVHIGVSIPPQTWPVPGASENKVLMQGPVLLGNKTYIVLGAPIIAQDNRRLGTDIVLFETSKLQQILLDYTGLGKRGETILAIPGKSGIRLLVPLRTAGTHTSPVFSGELPATSPIMAALQNALAQKNGIVSADASMLVAYRPLANTDWALAVKVDKTELYAPLYREMFIMVMVVLVLITGGYYAMRMVLQPLAKSILIKAGDLEHQVYEKTRQLEDAARALQDEKELLAKKNAELETAYADLKAAQSQMLQQEKMASIGQLAAGMAHELNNPMGFISSNLKTLAKYVEHFQGLLQRQDAFIARHCPQTEVEALHADCQHQKIDRYLRDAPGLIQESQEGAERIRKIIQDLQNFSRKDEADEKAVDLNTCLESTINILWNELNTRNASLHKELGPLPLVYCNPGQLNQVFMNVLFNAAQAIADHGDITVKTWTDHGFAWIAISDTGCGIPPEVQPRIFEPFFTTKEVGSGTGLGLSIAYEIVKKHQGEIIVDTTTGKGTTFTIKLPLPEENGSYKAEPDTECDNEHGPYHPPERLT